MFLFLMYLFVLSPRHECKHHVAVRFPSTYFHLFLLISVMPRRGEFNILLTRKLIIFIVLPFPFLCLFFHTRPLFTHKLPVRQASCVLHEGQKYETSCRYSFVNTTFLATGISYLCHKKRSRAMILPFDFNKTRI